MIDPLDYSGGFFYLLIFYLAGSSWRLEVGGWMLAFDLELLKATSYLNLQPPTSNLQLPTSNLQPKPSILQNLNALSFANK